MDVIMNLKIITEKFAIDPENFLTLFNRVSRKIDLKVIFGFKSHPTVRTFNTKIDVLSKDALSCI